MFRINRKLQEISDTGDKIRVSIVGCGKMGKGLISQMRRIDAMRPSVVVDHTPKKARDTLTALGVEDGRILETDDLEEANAFIERTDGYIVTSNEILATHVSAVEAVVEATGVPSTGARIAIEGMNQKKHVIMLNVECDAVVGPILLKKAQEAGVVYTGTKGDEPGAIIELVEFAMGAGFEVVAVGKGKNNALDHEATAASLREQAEKRGLSPRMLTSFVDGTNTMTELASTANALGFVPDVPGCHGITTDPSNIANALKLTEQGGILSQYGIVDFAFGMAPGVFAIVTSDEPEVIDLMSYLGLGDGPNYTLYRPYHLTSLETPITIFNAVVEKEASIAPIHGQVTDVATIAKKDCVKGEKLNGIGSDQVYGLLVSHQVQRENDYLPIALIDENTVFKNDVKKGQWITYADVVLDEESTIAKLRREQDALGL